MKKHRILTLLMAFALVLTSVPFLSFTADAAQKYDIPADVKELDLSNVDSTGWYRNLPADNEGDMYLPSYAYTVKSGAKDWVKFRVARSYLYVCSTFLVTVLDSNGYEVPQEDSYTFSVYKVNPGETYYIYADNKYEDDETIYVSDSADELSINGGIDDWVYVRMATNVTNPADGTGGWDVYKIGDLSSEYEWDVPDSDPEHYFYYYFGLDTISSVPVNYYNPQLASNFGIYQTKYKNSVLSSKEENKELADGEEHYKINTTIYIADYSSTSNRRSQVSVDLYIPTGYVLYAGDDNYLHVKESAGNDPDNPCAHSLVHHEAFESHYTNCRAEYWTCDNCGGIFSDVDCQNEISYEDTLLPVKEDHEWLAPEYKWTADNSTVTAVCRCKLDVRHEITETVKTTSKVTKAATSSANGETTYTATFSNSMFKTQTKTVANIGKLAKKANPMTVKAKKPTIKYSKLKKRNQTITAKKAYTVSNAQGTVTYKLVSVSKSKFKKYFKVNAKSGKITVKKKLKKGTYKVKVKVTAAGNANYNAAAKTVTVKVKVK